MDMMDCNASNVNFGLATISLFTGQQISLALGIISASPYDVYIYLGSTSFGLSAGSYLVYISISISRYHSRGTTRCSKWCRSIKLFGC